MHSNQIQNIHINSDNTIVYRRTSVWSPRHTIPLKGDRIVLIEPRLCRSLNVNVHAVNLHAFPLLPIVEGPSEM